MNRLWKEANENPAIPWAERKTDLANPEYDQDAKMIARLCLCYYSGSMNFKNSRRHEYMNKHENLDCLVQGCCQVDSLEHVGYQEKPKSDRNNED